MIGRFIIFGDSYSTHKDYIPKEYACYYCSEGRSAEQSVTKMTPNQTWWGQLIDKIGAELVYNDSWSGSTIGYTGYEGDCSSTSSFIYRYRKLKKSGFFENNKIDTIFVFGGTNDSWSEAPLGKEQYDDFCEDNLFEVLPAISYFMHILKKNHPDVNIVFIGNCDIKKEIIDCMKNVSERLNIDFVELNNIDKIEGHPTILGMTQICNQIIEKLNIV